MALRRVVGLLLAAAGLGGIIVASANPPMAGCPATPAAPDGVALTPMYTVDYCTGEALAVDAFDWFLLLNGVGLMAFLGGFSLVTYERLARIHRYGWTGDGRT
jgi:hypothetical protein